MLAETSISTVKTVIFAWILSILLYLDIDVEILSLYGILMFIDFLTWIAKSYRLKTTTSKRAFIWLMSKTLMIILILTCGIFAKILNLDAHLFLKLLIGALSLAEWYSIIANIQTFRTWKKQEEYDAVSYVLAWILKVIKKVIEKLLEKINKFIYN